MRRRALAVTTSTALAVAAGLAFGGIAAVADENTEAAEGQFRTYLATNTSLIPLDVTCAPLPDAAPTGPMICYALLSDRQVASALAELQVDGTYRFISINKVEPAAPGPGAVGSATSDSPADAAVLELIATATAVDSRLPAMLMQANPDITSVDNVSFFAGTGTLEVSVTTAAANDDVRNAIGFAVTEVLSVLWAEGQPLRDPAATVHPRLEVTVDGTLYSSAFGMMTSIADGTMTYAQWLSESGGGGPAGGRLDRRVDVKRRPPVVQTLTA